MATMILLRHGQSVWNAATIFTGWTEVDLSEVGVAEPTNAGGHLAETAIDVVHTSGLIRAQRTAEIVMENNRASSNVLTHRDIRLNERHYGDLQGMNLSLIHI